MTDKREIERRRLQEKMEQEKADLLANAEYMKKVQEEKEKGKKLVSYFLVFRVLNNFSSLMNLEDKDHFRERIF
jgi:hypothetical protein